MHDQAKLKWSEKRYGNQPPKLAKEENPMVYSMGMYERDQMKKVREERHKDLAKFYEEQVHDILAMDIIYYSNLL